MKPHKLAILGASGHGRVVADAALESGWAEIQFFDDRFPDAETGENWPISGTAATMSERVAEFDGVIVAVGNNQTRLKLHRNLTAGGAPMVSIIHPRAWASSRSSVGAGSMIAAGAVVNVGAALGEACIVNTGATVDHDCRLAAGVHIAPGAHLSGDVEVGEGSWIGVGASVRQGIRIGAGTMVGAGAVVVSDSADGVTVVGNPARPAS